MVTIVQGGPTGVHANRYYATSQYGWSIYTKCWYSLLPAYGFAVFLPNPRGSTGWGLEFAESNINDIGGKDLDDVLMGIDHCVERGVADPDRLGIAGTSYGGFMAGLAITRSDRFKAAIMGNASVDRRSFHGTSTIKGWVEAYLEDADPWDPDGTYRDLSIVNYVDSIDTPVLILQSLHGSIMPAGQAHMMYRALKERRIDTELVLYDYEGVVLKREQMVDLSLRTVEWFERYLG